MDSVVAKVFKQGSKRVREALGQEVSSDSDDSDYGGELPPYNPDNDDQLQARIRRDEETGRRRAESPTQMKSAHMEHRRILKGRRTLARQQQAQAAQEQASLQRQAAEFIHNFEINEMIQRINEALRTNVDRDDPRIRFVIGQIVNAHGLTLHSLRLMGRSKILLDAISDIAGRGVVNAGKVVYSAGQAVLQAAGRLASHGASAVTSRLPSLREALSNLHSRFSSQPTALGERARSPDNFLQVQDPSNLGYNQVFFQSQAPPPPPASAPAVEEDDCSICMTPLRDNVVLTKCGHKFHSACVTPWLNSHGTCPMCRSKTPTPLVTAPAKRQRQGGGSRKTRSKHNSKTRRLRKSRSKPRKSYKSRKPRCSSRRK